MVYCFFGHKDTPSDISKRLEPVLEELIAEGVDAFLVGHQGGFDSAVLHALRRLKVIHPHITYSVVLAYLPGKKEEYPLYAPEETMYPEGLENVHPRYAIAWRNDYLLRESDVVVTHITHTWGGAYKYAEKAKKKGKRIINIE